MLAAWTFFTHEQVFTDTPVELVGMVTVIALVIGAYRKIECHTTGCHRIGRFTHGHFHLCHVHHPNVPSNGRIGVHEIKQETLKKLDGARKGSMDQPKPTR
jgi:hypothetical protein